MDKRDIVLKIMGQIEEWADENDIATSVMDQIELAERIFNMLVAEACTCTEDIRNGEIGSICEIHGST